MTARRENISTVIFFFTYIYFTFLYENVCNVFAHFFFICVELMYCSLNIS